ncbi:UNVERIFIED_CONTAM: hypothetical protein Sangu_3258200 [Sesamum angustifolium]|uniref:Reverse transcriptase domain-containing protein n=1 Tax=Sesamum angustifolium TaxID=2727405 RepID=A0AAW2JDF2_9LAMI
MIKVASWNVRGLNGADHQRAVEHLVREYHISFIGLIETRVSLANVQRVRLNFLRNWSWFEDYSGPAGGIWLAWNPLEVSVEILRVEPQFIHCRAFNKRTHTRCLISVLYGDYELIPRRELWGGLRTLAVGISDEPWLVLGDFNAVLDDSEVRGRAADTSVSMAEFRTCMLDTGLVQLPFTGCPYTWHNCSEGTRSLWKRLDRMLVNEAWLEKWPGSSYISALPSTSDHSPLIISGTNGEAERTIFRFDNYLAQLPGFLGSVENIWKHHITGTEMYEVVCKLKALKAVFRQQRKQKGNLTETVIDLSFLRTELKHTLTLEEANLLIRPVTREEIKEAIFDIDEESAPGPDGYTSAFFKSAWPVVGQAISEAICEFFRTGQLLKQVNTTVLALIPKVNLPSYVSDYRPISCCNVLYKVITKVIVQRMQPVLHLLIDHSQTAFVPGRSIADNILLAQELLAGYNQRRLPPRCTLKVDIQKAYDSWNGIFCWRYRVQNAAHFQYHWKCKELGILNLCFADDVLLFCKAHIPSIQVLKDTLNEFAALSGLNVNPEKSQIILSRAVQQERQQIIDCLGFQEGFLPIRYLGVPLTSSRLTIADCRPLLTKVDTRLAGWSHHNLSYAGRVQLIRRGNAKVAWDQICKPKEEGGLGIRSMTVSNKALYETPMEITTKRWNFNLGGMDSAPPASKLHTLDVQWCDGLLGLEEDA